MNILTSLQKEIDKGNKYINNLGGLITSEKIETMARTEYLKQVKEGKCGNITFDKFLADYTSENFTETYEIFIAVADLLSTKTNIKKEDETNKKVDTTSVKPEDKKETKPNMPTPNKSKYTWI